MKKPRLIAIAGASCSGKTTLARGLADRLGGDRARVLSLDSYYHDLSDTEKHKIHHHNLDEPAALDEKLLIEHMGALARGDSIEKPIYDYTTHARTGAEGIAPTPYVIVEGLFTLYWPELHDLWQLKVFIDSSHSLCMERRVRRDRKERGRTVEQTTARYRAMVASMYDRYVRPTRVYANVLLRAGDDADVLVRRVLERLKAAEDDE